MSAEQDGAARAAAASPARRPGRTARPRDDWRIMLMIIAFLSIYLVVGLRMGVMALSVPEEPRLTRSDADTKPVRGEITDRNGQLLAANLPAWSLYARPRELKDPVWAANRLADIFPDMSKDALLRKLTSKSSFVWVKRPITPAQLAAVRDLGLPALQFGARDMRIYPAGRTAAHLVGGVKARTEDVRFAELVGSAGIERFFDARLRDPALASEPLRLSIDIGAQNALAEVLARGIVDYHAIGASGVLMKVRTGEILALVSLPDFDPNRPAGAFEGPPDRDPRFNRAVQGRYELGSIFKVLTAATALDTGVVQPESMVETKGPIYFGRQRIRDMHRMPDQMSVTDIVVRSSNVGSARLATMVGTERFKRYLDRLGLFDPLPLEVAEAAGAAPLLPRKWSQLSTMTVSFGHGIAESPVHLAAAFATLANGGLRVKPTLLADRADVQVERVFSPQTSSQMMRILREVVSRGTGRRADIPGYEVGGKTGTADKPRRNGRGYQRDKVISSFAAVFPTSKPEYVLLVSLDEPEDRSGKRPNRQASRTAVPVTGEAIRRLAPILGLRSDLLGQRPAPTTLPAWAASRG